MQKKKKIYANINYNVYDASLKKKQAIETNDVKKLHSAKFP
jgi:glutathionyl-hydroquinone reductase